MKKLSLFYIVCIFFLFPNLVYGKTEIRMGVFAYLGYEKTKEEYEPLIAYLNSILKDEVVILEVLQPDAIDYRIANKTLDIVTTNPIHYINIRAHNDIQGVIATLTKSAKGKIVSQLGGVIITKSNNTKINTLQDLKNKTLATPSRTHMGGYLTQIFEIEKIGLSEKDFKSVKFVNPHQAVVKEILKGDSEVGFIRDGVIEKMVAAGELNLKDIKIINKQNINFPNIVSTSLYPEWPIFALNHTNPSVIRHFASALYSLEATSLHGVYGYTTPADYSGVDTLVREMRLPPYDKFQEITFEDIWNKYSYEIIGFFIISIGFFTFIIINNKKRKFTEFLLESVGNGIYTVDKYGNCTFMNDVALQMLQYTNEEVLGQNGHILFHHHTVENELYKKDDCPVIQTLKDKQQRKTNESFIKKDGTLFSVHLIVFPTSNGGVIVIFRDITSIIRYEQKLETEVQEKTIQLKKMNESLQDLLNTDPLTELLSRKFFFEHLERDILLAIRNNISLSIISMDIDHFQKINESYGYAIGDEVLKFFSRIISLNLRKSDFLGRLDGEEFALLCYNTNIDGAKVLTQKIQNILENESFIQNDIKIKISCSYGIAQYEEGQTVDLFIKNSSKMLAIAKQNGENSIEIFKSK